MKKYNSIIILMIVLFLIFVNYFFQLDLGVLIPLFFVFLFAFLFLKSRYIFLSLGIVLGILVIYRYTNIHSQIDYSQDNKFFYVSGTVSRILPKEEYTILYIKDTVLDNESKGPNIYCYFFGELEPKIGDIVKFKNKIFIPKNKKIPGGFNFYNYLLAKDLTSYSYVDSLSIVGRNESTILNLQRKFDEFIKDKTSDFKENTARFLYSTFTGRNIIYENIKEDYRNLGISHILAISGFHIMIIYSFLVSILEFIGISMSTRKILGVLFVGFYCLLIDFPYSSLRAFLFLAIEVLAYLLYKPEDNKKTISVSALIILVLFPSSIFDLGFQLSFLAVLGMELLYPVLKNNKEKDSSLINRIWIILSVSIMIFPLQSYYFKEVSPFIFLGNLFVIPILTAVTYLFIVFLLLGFVPILGLVIKNSIEGIYSFSEYVILGLSPSKGFNSFKITFTLMDILIYFSIILILMLLVYYKEHIYKIIKDYNKGLIFYLLTIVTLTFIIPVFKPKAQLVMLDIGQGDCFLLKYNEKSFLIDTGGKVGEGDNSKVIIDNLNYNKVKALDGIFLSHLDQDHIGNLKYILFKFPNTKLYSHVKSYETLKNEYVKGPINLEELHKDDKLVYDSLSIRVLNSQDKEEENDNSLVLKVGIGKHNLLFTGDISSEIEKKILEDDIASQILKISHHGSKYSSTETFIDKVKPMVSLISVGEYNSYNHPDPKIIDYLENNGINVLRTDTKGNGYVDFYDDYFVAYNSTQYVRNIFFSNYGLVLLGLYGLSIFYFWYIFKIGGGTYQECNCFTR
ncbi:DNA internalization-related competence protein ComEC/Rec2 [Lagierella sp.]|uniref:DNA internalization-related competence protein ComEC/Rec2 n=1 Tax=Lagierella sp. TaxID=2849657 RepID=UPI002606FA06|nr:DNA internalization-related competence protein ComEC/Rec2 [Lagierella sp.]